MGTGRQIADYALAAYECGGGYIYGTQGITWTQAKQTQMEQNRKDDPNYAESIKYGKKWIDHRVWDCSGLTKKAAEQAGASIHHGSNSTWNGDCSHKGELTEGLALPIGAFVFVYNEKKKNRSHIGVVTGENEVTEASCARLGVIKSKIYKDKWDEWGLCKGVDFDFIPGGDPGPVPPVPEKKPTLKRGSTGPYVVECQEDLIRLGYDVGPSGADGKYGKNTEAAVKAFQRDHDGPDGVIGPKTWDMLESTPVRVYYTVTVPHLSLKNAEALAALYPGSRIEKEAEA
jgi:hypothetical protein